jgi:hypothetical protein
VVRAPDSRPRGPRFESRAWRIFYDLGIGKGVWVLDDGAGRRKGALAVYTPLGRACTVECCVCTIRAPLRNSGVQTGYSEPQRALWTMSNRQVPPLVNNLTSSYCRHISDYLISCFIQNNNHIGASAAKPRTGALPQWLISYESMRPLRYKVLPRKHRYGDQLYQGPKNNKIIFIFFYKNDIKLYLLAKF